jgi:signal transduction histidine kinase/DNA-binding NarL/FixJ family response regulator
VISQVLIADDEAGFRTALGIELLKAGHAVLQAADGQGALDCVEKVPLDLVIADAELPGLAGHDLLRLVRLRSPGTEVVLSTECPCPERAVSAFRSGAFDVLRKPTELSQLVGSATRALAAREVRWMRSLHEAGQTLFSLKEPERLASVIVELLCSVMNADVVSLMFPDRAGRLYIADSRGLPPPLLGSVRLPLGERIAGRVAESRRPILLRDELLPNDRFANVESHGRVKSSIIYPLVSDEQLLGVINIGRTSPDHPFGPHDLERAGVVASQIILALKNQRLWHQVAMSGRLATVGQVAGSIAHEINGPLCVVLGQTGIAQSLLEDIATGLKRKRPSVEVLAALEGLRSSLSEAEHAASAIRVIASDVRSAVRQSAGGEGLLDINDAIRGAMRLARTVLRKSAPVEADLDNGLVVEGDLGRLCQVFLNLLTNAAQALESSSVADPRIRIVSTRDGGEIRVDVVDNGPGVAAENVERVFEPFFTTKGPDEGTGLGLAISAEIVHQHGGRIEVQSAEGKETIFRVHLPALPLEARGRS